MTMRRGVAWWGAALGVGVLLAGGAPAGAGALPEDGAPRESAVSFEVAPRLGWMSGSTTYRIGGFFSSPEGSGYTNSPLSELKFPLDVWMVGVGAGLRFTFPYPVENPQVRMGGAFAVEGDYGKNITRDAGTVEDRDWTEFFFSDPTIYSESDAQLDASEWDVRARFYPLEGKGAFLGWRLGVGGGYLRQHFAYDVSNVVQTSWLYPEDYNYSYPGLVATYEVTYEIPYAEVAAGMTFGEGRAVSGALDARLAVSAWAHAADRDDHLLRSKLAEGDCDGDAAIFNLRGRVIVNRHFFATLGVTWIAIETEGSQTQTRYAATEEGDPGLIGTIDQKIFSDQTVVDAGVGFAF